MPKHQPHNNQQARPSPGHYVSTAQKAGRNINLFELYLPTNQIVHKVSLGCDDHGEIRLHIHALPQYGTHALHNMFFGDAVDAVLTKKWIYEESRRRMEDAEPEPEWTEEEKRREIRKEKQFLLQDIHPFVYYYLARSGILGGQVAPNKLKFRWHLSNTKHNAESIYTEMLSYLQVLQSNGLLQPHHLHIPLEHLTNYVVQYDAPDHVVESVEDSIVHKHIAQDDLDDVPFSSRFALSDAVRAYNIPDVKKLLSEKVYLKYAEKNPFVRSTLIRFVRSLFTMNAHMYGKAMEIIKWLVIYGADKEMLPKRAGITDYMNMFIMDEIFERAIWPMIGASTKFNFATLDNLIARVKAGEFNLHNIYQNEFIKKKLSYYLDAARIVSAARGELDSIKTIMPLLWYDSLPIESGKKREIAHKTISGISVNIASGQSTQSLDIIFFDGKRVTLESHWSKNLNATEKNELFEIYDRHFKLLEGRTNKTLKEIFYDEVVPDDQDIRLDIIRDEQGKVLAFVANQTFKTTINGKESIVSFNVLSLSSSELKPYDLMRVLSMVRGWDIAKHCSDKYDVYSYGDVVSMHGAYAMFSSENSFPKYAENADVALKIMKMIAPNVEFFCETINGVNIIYRKDIPVVLKESYNKQYLNQQSLVTMRQLTGEFFDSLVKPGSALVSCFQYTESYMQEFKEMILGIMSEYHMNILDVFYTQNSILADSNTTKPCRDSQMVVAYKESTDEHIQTSGHYARL